MKTFHYKPESENEGDALFTCYNCGIVLGYLEYGGGWVYLKHRLPRKNKVFVCKTCGAIQWKYTNEKRKESSGF